MSATRRFVQHTAHDLARIATVVLALGLVTSILFWHVRNRNRITELGYEIAEVTSEHQRLLEEHKKLRIEAAVVGRTERMTQVARERFGLEVVQPEQVRLVAAEVVVAGPEKPQTVALRD